MNIFKKIKEQILAQNKLKFSLELTPERCKKLQKKHPNK